MILAESNVRPLIPRANSASPSAQIPSVTPKHLRQRQGARLEANPTTQAAHNRSRRLRRLQSSGKRAHLFAEITQVFCFRDGTGRHRVIGKRLGAGSRVSSGCTVAQPYQGTPAVQRVRGICVFRTGFLGHVEQCRRLNRANTCLHALHRVVISYQHVSCKAILASQPYQLHLRQDL